MPPASVALASGEALSDLQAPGDGPLELCSGDVESCFHQYLLPTWARGYFSLPPLPRHHSSAECLQRLGLRAKGPPLHLAIQSVPMGWSWSVLLVQKAH